MNIRLTHARVLTMAGSPSDGAGTVTSGEVWVRGNRITHVGPAPEKEPADRWDRVIDLDGNLVMPGFKNAHTHSAMTFLRSYADDLPLQEWLTRQVFPMEAKLTAERVYHLTRLAILEYLTSGITANFDMYFFPEAVAKAAVDCGFRTVMCGSINNFTGSVRQLEEDFRRFNGYHELVGYRLGFHAEYTTSRPILDGIAELAHRCRAPVYTHNSETKREVAECIERNGATPTVWLSRLGLFDFGGGGFHCVHMTPEDMEIFCRDKLWAITNPGSNCKLASGIAPLQAMRERGIPMAIGTDGPASNNGLDMFREMYLTACLQKIREDDAAAMDAGLVLRMAAANGADAMGLPECDALLPGKLADLIVVDLHQPNMQPLNDIAKNIVYSGSKQNVKLTMINGRILYEDGQFSVGADPEEIYAKANEIIAEMKK